MMKVLIVDDETDVEILFKQQFRKEIRQGLVELYYAFSGDEALAMINSVQPPDIVCILSDINMPGMTGLELLRIVKEQYPHIRVSMITAYGDDANFRTAMNTGAEHYFTKPIDFLKVKKEVFNFAEPDPLL